MLETTVVSRSPSVVAAEVEGEIVMMSLERGCYFSLNGIGSDIWQRLEKECSLGELIDALTVDYDAARSTIAVDVLKFLDCLAANDMVRLS